MQLYVADYLGDTRHLTTEQHGAYLLLLMTMWRSEGRLPNDPKKLARIAGCAPARWAKISEEVLEYFTVDGDELTNPRLTIELEKASEKSIKRAENGSRGGKAKALKNNKADVANATRLPEHSSEPEPDKKPPVVPPRGTGSPKVSKAQVQAVWSACPTVAKQRSSVADVETSLNAALRRGHEPEEVLAGLLAAYRSETYSGDKAKGVHRLIEKDRWASFVEAGSPDAPAPEAVFDGPAEIRAWAAERHGEPFARSYIDPARWVAGERALIASNPFAEAKLRRELAEITDRWKFTIRVGAANDPKPTDLFAQGAAA